MLRTRQVVANGTSHSGEGLKLEEVALRAGDAQLLIRGALLGASQVRCRPSLCPANMRTYH